MATSNNNKNELIIEAIKNDSALLDKLSDDAMDFLAANNVSKKVRNQASHYINLCAYAIGRLSALLDEIKDGDVSRTEQAIKRRIDVAQISGDANKDEFANGRTFSNAILKGYVDEFFN